MKGKGTSGLVQDAAIEALDILTDVAQGMKTQELGDKAVLAQYAQHRGNPQAIAQFTVQRLPGVTSDLAVHEAQRYQAEMEKLWAKQHYGGD